LLLAFHVPDDLNTANINLPALAFVALRPDCDQETNKTGIQTSEKYLTKHKYNLTQDYIYEIHFIREIKQTK